MKQFYLTRKRNQGKAGHKTSNKMKHFTSLEKGIKAKLNCLYCFSFNHFTSLEKGIKAKPLVPKIATL